MRTPLLLVAALAGCASSSSRESLVDALAEYTHGIRWGRPEWVRPYLPAKLDAQFLEALPMIPGLQVITCEVEALELQKDARRAVAGLRVEWYQVEENRLRSSLVSQTWSIAGSRWGIVEQRLVGGARLPRRRAPIVVGGAPPAAALAGPPPGLPPR